MEKKVILVSHGKLSEGMAHSVQMICGETVPYYGMMPGEHGCVIADQIRAEAIANPETQYIVIADLFGGSVCNECTCLTEYENIKIISGMNMGLVIELLFEQAPISDETIQEKIEKCKELILNITPEYIKSKSTEDSEEFF